MLWKSKKKSFRACNFNFSVAYLYRRYESNKFLNFPLKILTQKSCFPCDLPTCKFSLILMHSGFSNPKPQCCLSKVSTSFVYLEICACSPLKKLLHRILMWCKGTIRRCVGTRVFKIRFSIWMRSNVAKGVLLWNLLRRFIGFLG